MGNNENSTMKMVVAHTSLNAAFYIKRSTERKRISYSQACNVSPFFSENRNVWTFLYIIKKNIAIKLNHWTNKCQNISNKQQPKRKKNQIVQVFCKVFCIGSNPICPCHIGLIRQNERRENEISFKILLSLHAFCRYTFSIKSQNS